MIKSDKVKRLQTKVQNSVNQSVDHLPNERNLIDCLHWEGAISFYRLTVQVGPVMTEFDTM